MSELRASIIIPHHEPTWPEPALLSQAIEAVLAHTPGPYEIIVVDGGSTPGVRVWLASWQRENNFLNALLLTANFGFTKHINLGLRAASGQNVVLLNSDIEVSPGWLEALESGLDDPQVGVVGCQIRDMCDREQIVFGGAVGPAMHKLGWADKGEFQERTYDDDYLTFACVLLRGETWRQVGELDEQFIIHCSDSDYCYRAKEAGWKLLYEPKAIVYHEQEGTLRHMRGRPAIEQILAQDQERFKSKWGNRLSSPAPHSASASLEAAATCPNTGNNQDDSDAS